MQSRDPGAGEEIERGLGRLAASGLVHVDPGLRMSLSKAGKNVARKAEGGIVEQLLDMDEYLLQIPLRDGHIGITPEEYAEALQRYRDRY